MSNTEFLPYARQSISKEDIEAVSQALSQEIITRGQLVEQFEHAIKEYTGASYAVAINSGSSALMAAYHAAEIGPQDRLITSPNTFVSTVGSAVLRGATPVFIDIEKETGNLNLEHLLHNINLPSSRGKAVIVPVHFAGIPVDMQVIDAAIADTRTVVVEDAAHAIGSHYKDGTKVGSCAYSQMTIFSFHPAKTITSGEGGVITTNDQDLYHKLCQFRNNGIERDSAHLLYGEAALGYYEVQALSGNYNFTEFQAALALSQLKRIDQFIAKRQKLLALYHTLLAGMEHVELLSPSPHLEIAPHLCVAKINFKALKTTRTAVMAGLHQLGIGTQMHYIPVYRHPFFAEKTGDISEYFPEMETYYAQALSLPLYYDLREEDVERVVKGLKTVLGRK